MTIRLFEKMLSPMKRAICNMTMRSTVLLVNSANKMQSLQIKMRGDEGKENIEHFEAYGFTSHPKQGAEAITLFFNGDRSHGVAIVVADRRYRLNILEEGEVALHDDQGQKVHLKRNMVEIKTPFTFRVDADVIQMHAKTLYQFDCNGHGQKWLPTKIDTWQIGEVAGTTHAIAPPEIP